MRICDCEAAAFIEAFQSQIEILFIMKNPGFGPGRCRLSVFRILEVTKDSGFLPHFFIEDTVNGSSPADKRRGDAFPVPAFGVRNRSRGSAVRSAAPGKQESKNEP